MQAPLVLLLGFFALQVYSEPVTPDEIQNGQELVQAVFRDTEGNRRERLRKLPTASIKGEVCFDEIGCFSKEDGPFFFTRTMPESPEKVGTTFSLYTVYNPDKPVPLSYKDKSTLDVGLLDPQKPLAVISHGLNENSGKKWISNLKESLLSNGFSSVIVVDWSNGAYLPFYGQAMVNTEMVGRQVAYILELLHKTRGLVLEKVHLLGYSLGAHLSGFAGKTIFSKLGVKIGRISGMDPAGPMFEDQTPKTHLSYQDATYVDVVHTSSGTNILLGDLGIVKPIGHVDFYPNGGRDQPGCGLFDLTCSHRRGNDLFLESLSRSSICVFTSYPCAGGYKDYKAGKCKECGEAGCGSLGFYSQNSPGRGSLYLRTNDYSPFCVKQA